MADFESFAGGHGQVLIASGTRDPYCPLDSLTALAHRLPSVRVTTIEGADHFFFGKLFPLGEALGSWIRRWLDA
jgi:pimeloyl-ACP methyl ester carboxylesterase